LIASVTSRKPAKLSASVGAPGPHDFTVRDIQARQASLPRPLHSIPTLVTVAKRPSERNGTKQEHKDAAVMSQVKKPALAIELRSVTKITKGSKAHSFTLLHLCATFSVPLNCKAVADEDEL
jgi:hypothetical protein